MIHNQDCILYLVRHGATENNLADPPVLQGRGIDGPLASVGIEQAESAERALAGFAIDRIYSSPLRRARQTAELIARPHGLDVTTVDEITEVDVGQWEGGSWKHIQANEPDAYRQFVEFPDTVGYKQGESLNQVRDRTVPALMSLLETNLSRRIVVVAHNVVNRVFVAHALGLPMREARTLAQDNCGQHLSLSK
ncbi:MAG: histidine phosphatase family protein [Pirellulaceae bacterium]